MPTLTLTLTLLTLTLTLTLTVTLNLTLTLTKGVRSPRAASSCQPMEAAPQGAKLAPTQSEAPEDQF